jgi:hypothetical protein
MTKTLLSGAWVSAAVVVAMTGTVRADVSPQDVWDQMQAYMSSFGYEVQTQPVADGSSLRLPELTMTVPVPADPTTGITGGTIRLILGDMSLTDQGNGTVSVDIPNVLPITVIGDSLGQRSFQMLASLTSNGLTTTASGNPNDITYDFSSAEIGMAVQEITAEDGTKLTPDAIKMTMTGATGSSRIAALGGATKVEQTLTMADLGFDIDVTEPVGGQTGYFKLQGGFVDVTSTGSATIPANFAPTAMSQALADGYAISANMTFATGQTSFEYADPSESMRYGSTSQGGKFGVELGAGGLIYDINTRGIDFSLDGSQIPFPIATSTGAFDFGLTLPLTKGDAPQPFGSRLGLVDLAVPEPIWMMIDRSGALPHDPVTAEVELSGMARLLLDPFDKKATTRMAMTGIAPGEITELTLDALRLKAGGAVIAATGGFDVDNSAKSVLNPALPAFEGQIDLRLTGVQTLLGTLGQIGIIPMPQVMMATGMIQQLGKPGNGPDDVSALIEISNMTGVTVNGAPMPFR